MMPPHPNAHAFDRTQISHIQRNHRTQFPPQSSPRLLHHHHLLIGFHAPLPTPPPLLVDRLHQIRILAPPAPRWASWPPRLVNLLGPRQRRGWVWRKQAREHLGPHGLERDEAGADDGDVDLHGGPDAGADVPGDVDGGGVEGLGEEDDAGDRDGADAGVVLVVGHRLDGGGGGLTQRRARR